MWFNILPAGMIIYAGLYLPAVGLYWAHYLFLGNHYRRSLLDRWERSQYQRDIRLEGSAYKLSSLDRIPPEEKKKKKGMFEIPS